MRIQAEAFGNPRSVTPENLASLTLLVEEGTRSVLLTGDARWDQLVAGLEQAGRLAAGGTLTIDVFKVPHHGSRNNIVDTDLLDRIAARHYVFCGNGEHNNPHPETIETMVEHRLRQPGPFKYWFNTSAAAEEKPRLAAHMKEVEALVGGWHEPAADA